MSRVDDAVKAINEGIAEMFKDDPYMGSLFGRQPRYTYYEFMGRMYCWTTERMSDGKFRAFEYRPFGKGARTPLKGSFHAQVKAAQVKLVREVKCATRKRAKALATKWYNEYTKAYWAKHSTPRKEG